MNIDYLGNLPIKSRNTFVGTPVLLDTIDLFTGRSDGRTSSSIPSSLLRRNEDFKSRRYVGGHLVIKSSSDTQSDHETNLLVTMGSETCRHYKFYELSYSTQGWVLLLTPVSPPVLEPLGMVRLLIEKSTHKTP